MYTKEQLNSLKADLEQLEILENRLLALNQPDMRITVRIEVNSKAYSFTGLSSNKEHVCLLKNDITANIARLKRKIYGTQIIHVDAY